VRSTLSWEWLARYNYLRWSEPGAEWSLTWSGPARRQTPEPGKESDEIVGVGAMGTRDLTGGVDAGPKARAWAYPEGLDDRILSKQLELLCTQWVRAPLPVAVACIATVYLVWDYTDRVDATAWGVITTGAIAARSALCWSLLRHSIDPQFAARWARRLTAFAFVNGLIAGAVAPFAFADLPYERLALMTMVLCCWAAAAIATSGSYPLAYLAFVWPFLAQIVLGWQMVDAAQAWLVSGLIVVLALVLTSFAHNTGRAVVESIQLRYANEELLGQQERLIGLLRVAYEKAESARAQAEEASRSKSRFLASASHDLRQPLHALSLLTSLLNDMTEDTRVREVGQHIDRSVQSLDGLFGALLDLSKLDAGAVTPERHTVGLAELVDRLSVEYQPKALEKGLTFSTQVEPIWIATDPILLERIVRNLIDNAIRFTSSGGVQVNAQRVAEGVVLSVCDTGVGIPDSEQARVFEEFYQLDNPGRDRSRGLGLGLSIVARLTTLLGYELKLKSSPARGATFTIVIPSSCIVPGPESESAAAAPADVDVAGLEVMFIEDDAEVRNAVTLTLERWGCRAIVLAGPEEAMREFESGRRPQVLICDLRLDQGVSGIATIQALREAFGPVPAAVVTGDISAERLAELRASGLPVLHKPVQARELRALVRTLGRPTDLT
jgi:signal transduction histidine kinase/CheY-like chemotaxis protein